MGPAVGIGFLQRALNALNRGASDYRDVPLDGRVGPATLTALDAFRARRRPGGEAVLLKAPIEALQGERYLALGESAGRRRNYTGESFVGRSTDALDRLTVSKRGAVNDWPSEAFHVWNLVARMLASMGYTK